jgi:antibiotic biosynthesis monooxygenase
MPTIDENRIFTAIIEWEVPPERQQALIDGVADEVEQHFKRYAGFVSASFRASEDGRRVIDYGQWHSKEDWSRARSPGDDEATAAIAEVIRRCGAKSVKVDTFRVARVVENAFNANEMAEATKGCDAILHLATHIPQKTMPKSKDWELNDRIRIEGTKHLAEAAAKNKIEITEAKSLLNPGQSGNASATH